jgi:hypothetical protein
VLTFLALLSGNELKTFPWDRTTKKLLILKVHQISEPLKIATVHLATPLFQLTQRGLFKSTKDFSEGFCGCVVLKSSLGEQL